MQIFAHTNGHDIEDVDYQEADQNEFFPEQSCDADEDSKSVPFSIKSKEEDMESKSSGGGACLILPLNEAYLISSYWYLFK